MIGLKIVKVSEGVLRFEVIRLENDRTMPMEIYTLPSSTAGEVLNSILADHPTLSHLVVGLSFFEFDRDKLIELAHKEAGL
jgi:hypothetical protein